MQILWREKFSLKFQSEEWHIWNYIYVIYIDIAYRHNGSFSICNINFEKSINSLHECLLVFQKHNFVGEIQQYFNHFCKLRFFLFLYMPSVKRSLQNKQNLWILCKCWISSKDPTSLISSYVWAPLLTEMA